MPVTFGVGGLYLRAQEGIDGWAGSRTADLMEKPDNA